MCITQETFIDIVVSWCDHYCADANILILSYLPCWSYIFSTIAFIMWKSFVCKFVLLMLNVFILVHTSLKRKCLHFDEIFITGCTESCQNDNFQCSQWWKFHQNDDIFVSVIVNGSYGCFLYAMYFIVFDGGRQTQVAAILKYFFI